MPESRKAIYWDANCWLSYINAIPERLPALQALLEASRKGSGVQLYTSAISKVEVAFSAAEQEKEALDEETEKRIESLWNDQETVVMVEYHDGIASSAKDLIRDAVNRGWRLKPLDAIHLATAAWLSERLQPEVELHTYDSQLLRWNQQLGFRIVEPYTPQPRMF